MIVATVFTVLLTIGMPDKAISVAIQPLGSMPPKSISAVKKGLLASYQVRVTVLTPVALPKEAFYYPRSRYRADKLLTFLAKTPGSYDKVLGITSKDISTTNGSHHDWGLFGLGQLPGRSCILSSFRLGRKGPKTRDQRLAEVAIHEVGHTFGLDHCPTAKCVMADAEGSIKTVDESTGKLCEICRRKLK